MLKLGNIYATPSVLEVTTEEDRFKALQRHSNGDWGDLCDEDKQMNDEALDLGYRILSSYTSDKGVKFWVITEADRSATTILLPEDY